MADSLARYGGGWFALALPAQSIDTATATVEQLRATMPAQVTCSGALVAWDRRETPQQWWRAPRRRSSERSAKGATARSWTQKRRTAEARRPLRAQRGFSSVARDHGHTDRDVRADFCWYAPNRRTRAA
jgi:GGDEF domain-containing protein